MYHSYFGLKEQVFSIAVDPQYLYMSSQHREALAHLLYGVESGGFVLLTGEVGTGKTTIVRCLLEQLPEATDLAIVLNPVASAPELLGNICDELRIPYEKGESSIKMLMDKLYEYLLANHTRGRNTVLLIDEAQLLRVSTLEQIRLLTNLETNTRKLLQIILVGQPELNRMLAKPSLRQLSQRITARYHLRALTLEETRAYISHRLHVGGMPRSQQPFAPDVIKAIHSTSRGIPRLINVLCDRMLLGAYSRDTNAVDAAICRQAVGEVLGEEKARARRDKPPARRRWLHAGGWSAAAALAAFFVWQAVSPAAPVVDAAEVVQRPQEALSETPVQARYRYGDRDSALVQLLDFASLDASGSSPCDAPRGYACETERLASWNQLQQLGRPAVLQLITPAKREAYVTLVGLDENTATVRYQGDLQHVALDDLGPLWTGEATYIWSKPEIFTEAVGYGSRGEIVAWIAERFAELDGQQESLAKDVYNRQLVERVRMFQRRHNLQPDGIFGARTLMALNLDLGIDPRLEGAALAQGAL